jgi:hypothetical protein
MPAVWTGSTPDAIAVIGERLALSVAYISVHEDDDSDIGLSRAIRLAKVLGVGVLGIDP